MRYLIYLLILGPLAYAQPVDLRDEQYKFEYEMALVEPASSIGILVYDSPMEKDRSLLLKISLQDCEGLRGVRLRLSNGDIVLVDEARIMCGPFAPNRSNVTAILLLTDDLQSKLDRQEIREFTIGNIRTRVVYKEPTDSLDALFRTAMYEHKF